MNQEPDPEIKQITIKDNKKDEDSLSLQQEKKFKVIQLDEPQQIVIQSKKQDSQEQIQDDDNNSLDKKITRENIYIKVSTIENEQLIDNNIKANNEDKDKQGSPTQLQVNIKNENNNQVSGDSPQNQSQSQMLGSQNASPFQQRVLKPRRSILKNSQDNLHQHTEQNAGGSGEGGGEGDPTRKDAQGMQIDGNKKHTITFARGSDFETVKEVEKYIKKDKCCCNIF